MALFRFRTRNPERDRQSDALRLQNIQRAIRDAVAETERERDGFRQRYNSASVDAAFSFENMENEGESAEGMQQVNDLTSTLVRFSDRITFLEKQIEFMRGIEESVTRFGRENNIDSGDSNGR